MVKVHVITKGFVLHYYNWVHHGEPCFSLIGYYNHMTGSNTQVPEYAYDLCGNNHESSEKHRTCEPVGAFPLYRFAHTSKYDKDNGWFSDNHWEFVIVAITHEAASADESSSASVDPNKIFLELSGGVNSKGWVFGVGSAVSIYYNTSQTSSSSQRSITRNPKQQQEIDALKE
ncbi:hypothetical protein V6N13_133918 [Hibiscus sabdariffa]